jgi:hypothetical protein
MRRTRHRRRYPAKYEDRLHHAEHDLVSRQQLLALTEAFYGVAPMSKAAFSPEIIQRMKAVYNRAVPRA